MGREWEQHDEVEVDDRVGHHLFAEGVDRKETEQAWRAWLARLSA